MRWSRVNFQCRGILLVWIRVGQGPTALAVGAGGGCLDILSLVYPFFPFSPSLWETTRYHTCDNLSNTMLEIWFSFARDCVLLPGDCSTASLTYHFEVFFS